MSSLPPDDGARLALERLLEDALGPLHTHVRLNLGPLLRERESVSDIVQSAVREVWKNRERLAFRDEAPFRAYLFQVATRKILEKKRYHTTDRRSPEAETKGRTASGFVDPNPEPSDHAASAEELVILQSAFDELDDADREVLSLCTVFELPTAQAARELGVPESTLRYRLGSATSHLLAAMARRGFRG
ncbi:MAG: RNA polymerase sigma factor [Planctomycetes bacterium]|nr:RNA polymerase sigma factor [Planctomycetota bacterium]